MSLSLHGRKSGSVLDVHMGLHKRHSGGPTLGNLVCWFHGRVILP